MPIQFPKINCCKIEAHIIKDYNTRITAIGTIIYEIVTRAKNASTRTRKLRKTYNFYY